MRPPDRADVRTPLIALPSFRALAMLGEPKHALLRRLLLYLRGDVRIRATDRWHQRKPPMAAY